MMSVDVPVMIYSLDAHGVLIHISPSGAEAPDYDRDEMIGRPSADFLTESSRRHSIDSIIPRS